MFNVYTFGPLRVVLDADTGEVLAVQCAKTLCAAAFLFSRAAILDAASKARIAWASTSDVCA